MHRRPIMRLWRGIGGLFCLLLVALACSHLKQVTSSGRLETVHARWQIKLKVLKGLLTDILASVAQGADVTEDAISQADVLLPRGEDSQSICLQRESQGVPNCSELSQHTKLRMHSMVIVGLPCMSTILYRCSRFAIFKGNNASANME